MSQESPNLLGRLRAGEHKRVLRVLLAIDLAFVVLTFLPPPPFGLPERLFHVGYDGSLAEWFQYGKAAGVAWLFFGAARRLRSGAYLVWSVLFLYLAIDDATRIHETLGGKLMGERWFLSSMGEEAYHYGQVLYALSFGTVALALLGFVWLRGNARDRGLTLVMAGLLGVFVGCAVGLDFASALAHSSGSAPALVEFSLGLGEELGEHVALSACLWAAFVDTRERLLP